MEKNKKQYIQFGIFFISVFISICCIPIYSDDYWWHVMTGEWIIQNNKVPTNDIFSWYGMENNLSWISHEWLSALVLYVITKIFGIHLVGCFFVLLTMILLLSLFLCLYYIKLVVIEMILFSLFLFFKLLFMEIIIKRKENISKF